MVVVMGVIGATNAPGWASPAIVAFWEKTSYGCFRMDTKKDRTKCLDFQFWPRQMGQLLSKETRSRQEDSGEFSTVPRNWRCPSRSARTKKGRY